MVRRTMLMALFLCSILALVGCSPGSDETSLQDRIWVLELYGHPNVPIAVLEDTEITIEFVSAEGQFHGSAGCNSYFGSYEVDKDKLRIKSPISSTEMACPEPVMEQEWKYLFTLQDSESYKIVDDQLTISAGDHFLLFKRQ